ncbi:MAG: hypothetical protein LBI26_03240, partial [Holosporales bacterium]|nr:hypothetical protein [Holosporales bacterium]
MEKNKDVNRNKWIDFLDVEIAKVEVYQRFSGNSNKNSYTNPTSHSLLFPPYFVNSKPNSKFQQLLPNPLNHPSIFQLNSNKPSYYYPHLSTNQIQPLFNPYSSNSFSPSQFSLHFPPNLRRHLPHPLFDLFKPPNYSFEIYDHPIQNSTLTNSFNPILPILNLNNNFRSTSEYASSYCNQNIPQSSLPSGAFYQHSSSLSPLNVFSSLSISSPFLKPPSSSLSSFQSTSPSFSAESIISTSFFFSSPLKSQISPGFTNSFLNLSHITENFNGRNPLSYSTSPPPFPPFPVFPPLPPFPVFPPL